MFIQTLLSKESSTNIKLILESNVLGQINYGSEIYLILRRLRTKAKKMWQVCKLGDDDV